MTTKVFRVYGFSEYVGWHSLMWGDPKSPLASNYKEKSYFWECLKIKGVRHIEKKKILPIRNQLPQLPLWAKFHENLRRVGTTFSAFVWVGKEWPNLHLSFYKRYIENISCRLKSILQIICFFFCIYTIT